MEDKFVAYYRTSTKTQLLGLEAQKAAVGAFLKGTIGATLVAEYAEQESGRNNKRPQLLEALRTARVMNAVLVVAKTDRLTRNVAFLMNLLEANVRFVAVDNPHMDRTMVSICAVIAQREAELISIRTKAALSSLKLAGKRLGCPLPITRACIEAGAAASRKVRTAKAAAWREDILQLVENAYRQGGSYKRAAEILNAKGVPARRGGEWTMGQVWPVLNRKVA